MLFQFDKSVDAPARSERRALPLRWLLLALTCLLTLAPPAKADPQQCIPLALANVPQNLGNAASVTNIGAVYKVAQNAILVYQYTAQIIGTSSPASTLSFGHNFTVGDGNWTSVPAWTNVLSISTNFYSPSYFAAGSNIVCGQFILSWTNFTGLAQGRLDTVAVSGATNVVVLSVSVGQRQYQPY